MKRLTDIEEILRILEKRGLNPIRMDDELPVFDAQVGCGLPNGVGDVSSSMKGSPSLLRHDQGGDGRKCCSGALYANLCRIGL